MSYCKSLSLNNSAGCDDDDAASAVAVEDDGGRRGADTILYAVGSASLRFQCPTLSEYHYLFNFITVQLIPIYPEPAQTIDSKGRATAAAAATKDKECELLPP